MSCEREQPGVGRGGGWSGDCRPLRCFKGGHESICLGSHDGHEDRRVYLSLPDHGGPGTTHIVSSAATGKTTLLVNMFLQDIERGRAAIFIDSDGDGTDSLLRCIPQGMWPRIVYLKPGDPDWVPLWNPLNLSPGVNPRLLTDMIVSVFGRHSPDFGDRQEHLLRNACLGLLGTPDPCLADVCTLLRPSTAEGKRARDYVLGAVQDAQVRKFFEIAIAEYGENTLRAVQRRIERLLMLLGRASLMLRQPDSVIDLRKILDDGNILLVDLSSLDPFGREMLGELILSSLHCTAYGRVAVDDQAIPFSLFIDGARQYLTSGVTNLMAVARRMRVNVVFADQFVGALQSCAAYEFLAYGHLIVGHPAPLDCKYFARLFGGGVKPEEFLCLDRFEMIARICGETVRFRMFPPVPMRTADVSEIIQESRRRYCRPVATVLRAIEARVNRRAHAAPSRRA